MGLEEFLVQPVVPQVLARCSRDRACQRRVETSLLLVVATQEGRRGQDPVPTRIDQVSRLHARQERTQAPLRHAKPLTDLCEVVGIHLRCQQEIGGAAQ